jgi:SAM-dependent methyltransferase
LDAAFLQRLGLRITDGVGLDTRLNSGIPKRISVVRADIARGLPVRSCYFDHAVMLAVLEHLDDPAATLREAFRILKPGGSLIISWPAAAVDPLLGILARVGIVSNEMESEEHQLRISLSTLVAILRDIGFERVVHHTFEFRLNNLLVAYKAPESAAQIATERAISDL